MKSVKDLVEEVARRHKGKTTQTADPGKSSPQLPLWPELERAIPNVLSRSSLFSPIARGRRAYHDRVKISSRDDVAIFYSGKQLDMADSDVFLQALEVAKETPLGQPVKVNRANFLREIGRPERGSSAYNWLNESMARITGGTVIIESKRYKANLHLIDAWTLDEEIGEYTLRINPEMLKLFSNREFGYINWQRRLQIKSNVDLTKWMQDYIVSNERGEQRTSLELLRQWCGMEHRRIDHFQSAMESTLQELQRIGEITNPQIREPDKMVIYIRL